MTTTVKIINESSNTTGDCHAVRVRRVYNDSTAYTDLIILAPGANTDVHVWTGTSIVLHELVSTVTNS